MGQQDHRLLLELEESWLEGLRVLLHGETFRSGAPTLTRWSAAAIVVGNGSR
jgi:hypothetical protein